MGTHTTGWAGEVRLERGGPGVVYVYTRIAIANNAKPPEEVHVNDIANIDKGRIGEHAAKFVRALFAECEWLGLVKVIISKYQLTLIKRKAFDWPPLRKAALGVLSESYLDGRRLRVKWLGSKPYLRDRVVIMAILAGLWAVVVALTPIPDAYAMITVGAASSALTLVLLLPFFNLDRG